MTAPSHDVSTEKITPKAAAKLHTPTALMLALGVALLPAVALGATSKPSPGPSPSSHPQAYLGVELHDITDDQVAALHIPSGHAAEVTMVDHDGPAGKAGLQPHDVVVQVDGQAIENADDFRRRIRESAPGKVLSLAIMRLGRMMTLTAKLANREELERNAWQPQPIPNNPATETENVLVQRSYETPPAPRTTSRGQSFIGTVLRSGPYTGLSLEAMEPQLAGFFGVPPKIGLLVHEVDTNSPAANAGLRAGDVVLRVDLNVISTPSEWSKRVKSSNGRPVSLTIIRDKHEQTVTLQPDLKRHSLLEWPKLF